MKNYFMELFEIEAGEYSLKEVVTAGVVLVLVAGVVFMPLFVK